MKTILLLFALVLFGVNGCSTPQNSTTTTATTVQRNRNVKMINGKPYVWVAGELGSNIPGRWVPADSPDAEAAVTTQSVDQSAVVNTQNAPHGLPKGD